MLAALSGRLPVRADTPARLMAGLADIPNHYACDVVFREG
jgi:hypothetical protein